jgi:hypothetical protein
MLGSTRTTGTHEVTVKMPKSGRRNQRTGLVDAYNSRTMSTCRRFTRKTKAHHPGHIGPPHAHNTATQQRSMVVAMSPDFLVAAISKSSPNAASAFHNTEDTAGNGSEQWKSDLELEEVLLLLHALVLHFPLLLDALQCITSRNTVNIMWACRPAAHLLECLLPRPLILHLRCHENTNSRCAPQTVRPGCLTLQLLLFGLQLLDLS